MADLKNIFIGDQVVQQAYLNDGLLYQSDGWTNTPVSKLPIFQTPALATYSHGGATGVVNSKNELIIVDYNTPAINSDTDYPCNYRVTKVSTATGAVVYSATYKDQTVIPPLIQVSGAASSKGAPNNIPAWINKKDVIYIGYTLGYNPHMLTVTDTGTDFEFNDTELSQSDFGTGITGQAYDANNVYTSNGKSIYISDYTFKGSSIVSNPSGQSIKYLTTNTSSNYVYGMEITGGLVKLDKSTGFITQLSTSIPAISNSAIAMDAMNNLYVYNTYSNGLIYKYSTVNNTVQLIRSRTNTGEATFNLAFDNKYNIYSYCKAQVITSSSSAETVGIRYNNSGGEDWVASEFYSEANRYFPVGSVCIDNYGNVYFIATTGGTNSYCNYRVYKYINLTQ